MSDALAPSYDIGKATAKDPGLLRNREMPLSTNAHTAGCARIATAPIAAHIRRYRAEFTVVVYRREGAPQTISSVGCTLRVSASNQMLSRLTLRSPRSTDPT